LKTIDDYKKVDPITGSVSFDISDGMFNDALAVLESSVKFDEAIPESMYRGLTFDSIAAVVESKALTTKAFMDELSRRKQAYKRTPSQRYVLTTSLSARNLSDSLSHTGISETRITFGERLPKLFRMEHERMRQNGRHVLFGDPPSYMNVMRRYTFARVSVWAQSEIEAVESALTASTFSEESGTST
jgi:hypothetical protein